VVAIYAAAAAAAAAAAVFCFSGAVDSTLLEATDILPTVADLAGLVPAAAAAAADSTVNSSTGSDSSLKFRETAAAAAVASHAAAAAAELIRDQPWDGISFKNLLLPVSNNVGNNVTNSSKTTTSNSSSSSSGYRGTSLATQQQLERYVISVSAHCWSPDAVPLLDENRYATRFGLGFSRYTWVLV
jgi:hypothetical protein